MKSPLIAPALEEQFKPLLDRLTTTVELICIPGSSEKGREMAVFLQHFSSLSPYLSCHITQPGDSAPLDKALDTSLLPATGITVPGQLPRMIFHGIPGGKEITAFVSAILNAGSAAKPLDRPTVRDIAKVRKPMCLQICISLACQHCSQLVANAHRTAWENPMITAHMIDANLYPELVKTYDIQRVPLTVINGEKPVPGGMTMAELTTLLAKHK